MSALSHQAQVDLVRAMREDAALQEQVILQYKLGQTALAPALLLMYTPMIHGLAVRYMRAAPYEDVRQEASIAVLDALRTWRPDGGCTPLTWLRHTARWGLERALRTTTPTTVVRFSSRERVGYARAHVRTFSEMQLAHHGELDSSTFEETLTDDASLAEDMLDDQQLELVAKTIVTWLCTHVGLRSYKIAVARIGRGRLLDRIGAQWGFSRERARQLSEHFVLQSRALIFKKLRVGADKWPPSVPFSVWASEVKRAIDTFRESEAPQLEQA